MKKTELKTILKKHALWLDGKEVGVRADLIGADLTDANLTRANLTRANLTYADLTGANLTDANLTRANLIYAYLTRANLTYADLTDANLTGADLTDANLTGADLTDANLTGAETNYLTAGISLACPESGSFEAWKKVNTGVIRLLIPAEAKRSSATTRKCRAEFAVVLVGSGTTEHNGYITEYKQGETVKSYNGFNANRWIECGEGIHFFMNKHDAETYQ